MYVSEFEIAPYIIELRFFTSTCRALTSGSAGGGWDGGGKTGAGGKGESGGEGEPGGAKGMPGGLSGTSGGSW